MFTGFYKIVIFQSETINPRARIYCLPINFSPTDDAYINVQNRISLSAEARAKLHIENIGNMFLSNAIRSYQLQLFYDLILIFICISTDDCAKSIIVLPVLVE